MSNKGSVSKQPVSGDEIGDLRKLCSEQERLIESLRRQVSARRTDTSKYPIFEQLKRVGAHAYDHDMLEARQICNDVCEFFLLVVDEVTRLEKRLNEAATDAGEKAA